MHHALAALVLCSVPLFAGCASWSGIPEPFDQLSGPFWKESHGVTVAADESALVVDMSGPHPCMIAYDADLDETEYMAHHIGSIAFAAQGNLALWSSISRTYILVPPDMDVVHSVEVPRFFGSNAVIVADPLAHRWVAI